MTHDELVEKVARAISTDDFIWEDRPGEELRYTNYRMKESGKYLRIARIAITITLAEAAKVAEQYDVKKHGHLSTNSAAAAVAAAEIATTIRAMKEGKP